MRLDGMLFALATLALVAPLLGPGARAQAVPPGDTAPAVGTWAGTLTVPGAELRIVFHIESAGEGYTATMDSPDQGAFGIAVTEAAVAGDSVVLRLPALNGEYRGALAGETLSGTWSQGGMTLPLDLERTEESPAPSRPQEPEPPFPYAVEEVSFTNATAGIRLAGTLTLPDGAGPFPAAVLISGSGPQDRDESLMGHRPFLVLADHLTRQGIAVLRFDDRGVGESEGDFATATSREFATDVEAAARFLRGRPEVDPGAIGLIGHSEGGIIAPMVAHASDDVAWIVLLAGPGLPGDSLLRIQGAAIARAAGQDEATVARQMTRQRATQRIAMEVEDPAEARRAMREAIRESVAELSPQQRARAGLNDPAAVDSMVERSTRQMLSPWVRFFLSYDPAPDLRRVDVPTLALLGERDLQVPAAENAPALRAALEASDAPTWDVRVLPGLNHLFQHAGSGLPTEYGRLEETFAPEAMEAVAEWVLDVTGGK